MTNQSQDKCFKNLDCQPDESWFENKACHGGNIGHNAACIFLSFKKISMNCGSQGIGGTTTTSILSHWTVYEPGDVRAEETFLDLAGSRVRTRHVLSRFEKSEANRFDAARVPPRHLVGP